MINGSQRDALGKEQPAEAKGSNGEKQKWLRLGTNTAYTRGETIFLGLSWCNFDLLAYIRRGASDTLLETLGNHHLLIINSLLWRHESKLNIVVYFVPHNKDF